MQQRCPLPMPVAVVLVALAFFALRPGKGWLRRKPLTAPAEDGSDGKAATPSSSELGSRPPSGPPGAGPSGQPPASVPPLIDIQGVDQVDTLLPYSRGLPEGSTAGLDTLVPYTMAHTPAPTAPQAPSLGNHASLGYPVSAQQPRSQHLPFSYITSEGPGSVPLPLGYVSSEGPRVAAGATTAGAAPALQHPASELRR